MSEQVDLISAGIERALALPDTPLAHKGYLQPMLGWNPADGGWGSVELGLKPKPNLGIHAYGKVSQLDGPEVGIGARWEFW